MGNRKRIEFLIDRLITASDKVLDLERIVDRLSITNAEQHQEIKDLKNANYLLNNP